MQPVFEIKHHPVDLSVHGLNPYGQPLYRVVWADDRKTKVISNGKRYTLQRYCHGTEAECRGHWILEKWGPPEVIVKMNRHEYEEFCAGIKGAAVEEYPEKGEYELSAIFCEKSGPFAATIDEIALHKQLAMSEWRAANMTLQDHVAENVAQENAKQVEADKQFDTIYEEAREASLCN